MLLSVDSFVQANRGFGAPSASAKQDTLRLDDKDDGLDFLGNALKIFGAVAVLAQDFWRCLIESLFESLLKKAC